MLNKEKYAKEILDIVCSGDSVALKNGCLYPCANIACEECDLNYSHNCHKNLIEWANSEYKEHKIDWSKVPIDTPIYVWDGNNKDSKKRRYFAKYKDKKIYAFMDGTTSWTGIDDESDETIINNDINENFIVNWDNAEIKEGVDCSEWYKD